MPQELQKVMYTVMNNATIYSTTIILNILPRLEAALYIKLLPSDIIHFNSLMAVVPNKDLLILVVSSSGK